MLLQREEKVCNSALLTELGFSYGPSSQQRAAVLPPPPADTVKRTG